MMLDGTPSVNAGRAETTGCLALGKDLARKPAPPLRTAVAATDVKKSQTKFAEANPAKLRAEVKVNVFVQTTEPKALAGKRKSEGNLSVLRVSLDEVRTLVRKNQEIAFIENAENLKKPGAIRLATASGDANPSKRARNFDDPKIRKLHRDGQNVLIGIIDVEGFDWAHQDFDGGKGNSRFISIWDQGRERGEPPAGFDYGVEITQAAMKKAAADAPKVGVSPHDLEPQSQMIPGSHGTHVASIAAGNSGVCGKADIAAVLVSMPPGDVDRRMSFYDSTRLLDAVNYLLALAERRKQPISINISLGTNGHAHDGSSALDRWIDAILVKPGRSICVAAGNAGQERGESPGDLGYIFGRIHTSGRIAARGLDHIIEWNVAGDDKIDASENELELWYESQDRISVSIMPPGGSWIGPVAPGEYIENKQLPDKCMLSLYNELYHPANGHNYIAIYLTPFIGREVVVGVTAGTWLVRLEGTEIRDGRFHGWIERDDPIAIDSERYFWPSYFSARSNVDAYSVSSLACGQRIVSVANLDEAGRRINISSSQGPTRDGRFKPDVAACGTEVSAANGFGRTDEPWISMTGTSMASPFVAGVVGLMLATQPKLNAAQVNGILRATAQPLPGGTYDWANDAGFGVVDPRKCIEQAHSAHVRKGVERLFK